MDGIGFGAAAAAGSRTPLPCSVSSVSRAKAAARSHPPRSFGIKEWKSIRELRGLVARGSVSRFCLAGGEGLLGEEIDWETKLVRTLLIDNYDSYTYNIYQDLSVINGVPPVVVSNDEWTWDHARRLLLGEQAFDNIVVSPGPGTPERPGDIGICLNVLLECKDIPILGVCLGHQALGYVHGAKIIHAPQPVHGRLSEIEHTGNNLFFGIPSGADSGFKVVRYHSLIVEEDTLPDELIPIAWTTSNSAVSLSETHEASRTHNLCNNPKNWPQFSDYSSVNLENARDRQKVLMGIMHSRRPHYGVQFHPESIATSHGRQIFRNFKRLTVNHGLKSKRKVQRASGMAKDVSTDAIDLVKNKTTEKLKLVYKKFKGLARKIGGSGNIFLKLFGDREAEDTFWLDSSSTEQKRARFSFMGGKGGPLWKQITFYLSDKRGGGHLSIRNSSGESKTVFLTNGFLEYIDEELKSFHYDEEDYRLLPFDFCGGFVGYLGYGLKVECGASSNSHKSMTPDACFFFADNLLVVDHENDDVFLLSLCGSSSLSSPWLDSTEKRLIELLYSQGKSIKPYQSWIRPSIGQSPRFVPEKSRIQYMDDVEKCLEFIIEGESYELCLTTQMKMRVGQGFDSLGAYFDLRERNPAPYAAWMNFSQESLSILCSSPERFLKLDSNGTLEAKPIKGTVARGSTLEEDYRFKIQLQNSEKDQAENLMIVDLLRNDLGRVCRPGTVRVPHLMKVESYATVHTLVSTVQGEKSQHLSPVDCVRAAFPGGSMTGAPKLRSMEILDSLECCPRGIYSGSIGFFSYNKRFDLNIVIRSVIIHNGEASIGAGGAVVTLSDPKDEYDEMMLKSKAPAQVIEDNYHQSKSQKEKMMTMLSSSGELCGPSCS